MISRQAALGFLGLLLVLPSAWADAAPHLLGNLNRGPSDPVLRGMPANFFQLGKRLLFSTADPESLDQGILWSTDGSARGTRQLSTTLCTNHCAAIVPLGTWRGIELLRIKILLPGAYKSYRLGRTDGTAAGTFLLTEELSSDEYSEPPSPLKIYVIPGANAFFFSACLEVCSLWQSDGTVAGPVPFLSPLDGTRFRDPHGFTLWRERLYFVTSHGEGGTPELWSTDGTAGGTHRLHEARDFRTNVSRSGPLVATPSHLFFTSGETGEDLWATDGSPEGTRRLADFAPTRCHPYCETPGVYSMTAWRDQVFFGVRTDGQPVEIWRSDGTGQGTRPLRELPSEIYEAVDFQRFGRGWLFQGNDEEGYGSLWTARNDFQNVAPLTLRCDGDCPTVRSLRHVGPRLWLFAGYKDDRSGLWSTDGVRAQRLADVCPGFDLEPDDPDLFPGPDGKIYFRGCPPDRDPEQHQLWVTDGSPAGTYQIGGEVSAVGFFGRLVYFGGSPRAAGPGAELWVSDGGPGLGRRIATLRRYRPGSDPQFQAFGNRVLLAAAPGENRVGLWTSDGTKSGTLPVAELPADATGYFANFLDSIGSHQLFTVARTNEEHGYEETAEIWRTDGTAQGTEIVATLPTPSYVDSWTLWNGKLLFCAYEGTDSAIGITDGTASGTREILFSSEFLCPVAVLGSHFLYHLYESGQTRLFVSDGTTAGTRPIATFAGSYGWLPVQLGGTIYFELGASSFSQLWQTDGTPEGTRQALPLNRVEDLQALGDSLYMTAELPEGSSFRDRGLFRFRPGTAPVLLTALRFTELVSGFAAAGERWVFSVQDDREGGSGFELWVTDGTPQGTQRIRTFERLPNDPFPFPENLSSDGRRVFFAASDGVHGREIWESNGTLEGTRMVLDLAPGGYSAIPAPGYALPANGYLFFAGDDGKAGVEPWAVPLNP
jgi:ELWxxDGT repeat protein